MSDVCYGFTDEFINRWGNYECGYWGFKYALIHITYSYLNILNNSSVINFWINNKKMYMVQILYEL